MLTTDRLSLRPVTMGDVATLHAIWSDAGVRRYLWDDVVIDRATAHSVVADSVECWRERGYGLWLIARDNAAIGFVGFRPSEDAPELLFGLLPSAWHQGLATEAACAVLRHLAQTTNVSTVWAETDPPNLASTRVLERLGMTRVSERRFVLQLTR